MIRRRIRMRQLTQVIALVTLGIFWGASNEAGAAEQRCNELGANCICSEPLNSATYTTLFGYDFNPADTTTKECTKATPSAPGSVLEDGQGFRYVAETSGEMFTNMPNRSPSITRILRTKTTAEGNGGGGGEFIGHQFAAGVTPIRRSWRGYLYFSNDYELYTNPTCVNSTKIIQMGHDSALSAVLSESSSNYEMYGWTGWNFGVLDCCIRGPGGSATWGTYTASNIRGKWFRFEMVMTNTATSGSVPTTFTIYMKNITDDLPEVTIIDSTVPTTQPAGAGWTSTIATTMKPSATNWDQVFFDLFRRDTCAGFKGMSHIMTAAWSTDSGQRIGAASEIEGGGGGDTVPPVPPTNLRVVSMLMEEGQ